MEELIVEFLLETEFKNEKTFEDDVNSLVGNKMEKLIKTEL